jgi:hypothetical protein
MSEAPENKFPVIWGGEEEGSWRYVTPDYDSRRQVPRPELEAAVKAYRRDPKVGIQSWGTYNDGRLDTTGGGLYVDRDKIELVTPEVETADEYKDRIRGNEHKAPAVATSYLKANPGVKGIDINRRVADGRDNVWGNHDNLGYEFEGSKEMLYEEVDEFMVAHLLTRPFITGAGMVRTRRLHFAQKMIKVWKKSNEYGFTPSLYRGTRDEGLMRAEMRCSDINILEIPLDNRLGGTAIAMAIALTPPMRENTRFQAVKKAIAERQQLQLSANAFNTFRLSPDGKLLVADGVRLAMEFQRAQHELFLSDMAQHADVPQQYLYSAQRHIEYFDLFDRVVAGELDISALGKHSDWAAKFRLILRRITRDQKQGYERTLHDGQAQRDDLAYDIIRVVRGASGIEVEKAGYGYQLRDRYAGDAKPTEEQLQAWAMEPPTTGRARLRAELIRDYHVTGGSWGYLHIGNRNRSRHASDVRIYMHDPRRNTLDVPNQDRLDTHARRRAVKP